MAPCQPAAHAHLRKLQEEVRAQQAGVPVHAAPQLAAIAPAEALNHARDIWWVSSSISLRSTVNSLLEMGPQLCRTDGPHAARASFSVAGRVVDSTAASALDTAASACASVAPGSRAARAATASQPRRAVSTPPRVRREAAGTRDTCRDGPSAEQAPKGIGVIGDAHNALPVERAATKQCMQIWPGAGRCRVRVGAVRKAVQASAKQATDLRRDKLQHDRQGVLRPVMRL